MAKRVEVLLTDDLDGKQLAAGKGETVQFALDGVNYEIDLSSRNATALRKALEPYVGAGRQQRLGRTGARGKRTHVGADAVTVKEWARTNGYEVSDRGRVPNEVRAAFEAAQ